MLTLVLKQFATSLSQMLGRFNKLAVPSVQDQTLRISARGSQMQLHDACGVYHWNHFSIYACYKLKLALFFVNFNHLLEPYWTLC